MSGRRTGAIVAGVVALGLLLATVAHLAPIQQAWAQATTRTYILQNAATANGAGAVAHAAGFSLATVQIVIPAGSSPIFTIQFEQSLNDIHYVATLCMPHVAGMWHNGVSVTPALAAAAVPPSLFWRCNIAGAQWFRARLLNYTGGTPAGTVTVTTILTSPDVLLIP